MLTVHASQSERQCHLVDGGSVDVVPNQPLISSPYNCFLSVSLHRSNIPGEDSKARE